MSTPASRLRPLLAAVLCVLVASSSALATEPAPPSASPGEPAPTAEPAVEPSVEPPADPSSEPSADPSSDPTADPSSEPSADPSADDPAEPVADPPRAPDPGRAAAGRAGDPPSEDVIVILREGSDAEAAASRARGLGARVERTFRHAVRAYAAEVSPAQARRLADDPRVLAVVPDEFIAADEGLTAQSIPTGIRRVYGNKSAAARINGVDERVDADVAIFDTGIDPTHTDLNVAGGYNCTTTNRSSWKDEQGHGTHVAGTVGALDNGSGVVGVAPGVRLWAVRILDANGEGRLSWWICGLDWIASQKDPADSSRPLIEAVNMSVTRWGRDDNNCGHTNDDVLHQAVCRVVARGITVVAAAANDSASAAKRTPAAYDEVITVSALADTDGKPGALGGDLCWSWGTYDKDDTFANFSNHGADVDLIAPGKCIWSTKRGQSYGYSSGTSMAAPHVAGAAALYLASRRGAPPSEVRWALRHLGNLKWKTGTDPDGKPDILLDVSRLGPLGDFSPTAALPATGLVANETGTTWTIPLDAGRGTNFIEPISFSHDRPEGAGHGGDGRQHEPLRHGFRDRDPNYGPAGHPRRELRSSSCGPPTGRSASARSGWRSWSRTRHRWPPRRPPRCGRAARASLATAPLALSWKPATDQSPIVRYQLGESPAGYEPVAVATTSAATRSATRRIPYATSRVYAVRATDAPGNVGRWAKGAAVRVVAVQERSTAVRRSAGWTRYDTSDALGGRFLYSDRAGAWMRYSFTGSAIALVGRKGPNRGRAEIRIDGVLVATVSARAKSASGRWLLFSRAVDPRRSHTIEVRVLGTAGHPRFDVDAFLVLK